jgi:alkylhydroperoxidase family enzyme
MCQLEENTSCLQYLVSRILRGKTEPRIPPLPADQLEKEHAEVLDRINRDPTGARNVTTTLLRHPLLFRRWMPLAGQLLYGSLLPHRDRELLILRTASNCHADYEWAHHVVIGRQAGLTDEEIERVRNGPTDGSWSSDDAVLLTAADELHHDSRISDTTWAARRSLRRAAADRAPDPRRPIPHGRLRPELLRRRDRTRLLTAHGVSAASTSTGDGVSTNTL